MKKCMIQKKKINLDWRFQKCSEMMKRLVFYYVFPYAARTIFYERFSSGVEEIKQFIGQLMSG